MKDPGEKGLSGKLLGGPLSSRDLGGPGGGPRETVGVGQGLLKGSRGSKSREPHFTAFCCFIFGGW